MTDRIWFIVDSLYENEQSYWNNLLGWVDDFELAELFTDCEQDRYCLPDGGWWATYD
jgi:hypothetical protein